MKKTDRKNKTGLTVKWPAGIFTVEECHNENPNFVNITLRVRIRDAILAGDLNEIGYLHNNKGRPRLVLVKGTITQQHIDEAKRRNVILKNDLVYNSVNILTKTNDSDNTQKTKTQAVESESNTTTNKFERRLETNVKTTLV
jgi:hypothetical protein